jgi:hypothetical protein
MWLRALDAETGAGVWTNTLPSTFSVNPPTYDSGAVYLLQSDGGAAASFVRSFNATNGLTNWATSYPSQGDLTYAPVVTNGAVYCSTGLYGGLTGYNRTNGVQKFFTGLYGNLGCDQWTPAYYNGKVYMWVNGYFSEHDPQTGSAYWILTNAAPSEFGYSMYRSVAIANGRAYFTSTTKLFCVDLSAHQNVWTNNGAFSGTPAVANGVVYAISNTVVQAFNTNGVLMRTYDSTNQVEHLAGQMIVTDDVLMVTGRYGIYIFRLSDGTIQQFISAFHQSCSCYYSPSISLANNTLYVTSSDQNVYAYAAMPTVVPTLVNPVQLGDGAMRFGFTNISGASFSVWANTNAALPLNGWSRLGNATEITSGQYQFTDVSATNYAQRYYCVSSP